MVVSSSYDLYAHKISTAAHCSEYNNPNPDNGLWNLQDPTSVCLSSISSHHTSPCSCNSVTMTWFPFIVSVVESSGLLTKYFWSCFFTAICKLPNKGSSISLGMIWDRAPMLTNDGHVAQVRNKSSLLSACNIWGLFVTEANTSLIWLIH